MLRLVVLAALFFAAYSRGVPSLSSNSCPPGARCGPNNWLKNANGEWEWAPGRGKRSLCPPGARCAPNNWVKNENGEWEWAPGRGKRSLCPPGARCGPNNWVKNANGEW